MKNRFQNKMILTFSLIFLILLILLILAAYLFLDDFYISSNKRAMIESANQFEERVRQSGPGPAQNNGTGGSNITILSPTYQVRGPSQLHGTSLDLDTIKSIVESSSDEVIFSINKETMYCIKELRNGDLLVLTKPLGLAEESKRLFYQFMIWASLIIYIIGVSFIIFTARRISHPIEKLNKRTRAISQLSFGQPVLINRRDELGDLATNINVMAEKLEASYGALERELAEEKRLDQMRRQFVSNVSHELKNPLTMIQGYADGLTKGIARTEEAKERYYNIIFSESEKMTGIINDLLDLSAYEAGTMTLKICTVSIKSLIDNCLEAMDLSLKEKEITLEKEINDISITCDELRISQVITNLIANAIKYNWEYGKIILLANTVRNNLRITVKNTGPQMTSNQLENIWQSFYQADSSNPGSGLGLAIVKSIVTMHNGQVNAYVENDMNCFEVILPLKSPQDN